MAAAHLPGGGDLPPARRRDLPDDEPLLLTAEAPRPVSKPLGRARPNVRRALVAGGLLAACGAAVVLARGRLRAAGAKLCSVRAVSDAEFVFLAEAQTGEISKLVTDASGRDIVREWLEKAGEGAAGGTHVDHKQAMEEARHTLQTTIQAGDKGVTDTEITKRVLSRSVSRWHKRREQLREFALANKRALRWKPPHSPKEKAVIAECVFNVEQATTQLAALGASIADSAKTCVPGASWTNEQGKVCVINLAGIAFAVSTIAGSLSVAANNCADTLTTNVNALCTGALSGLGAQVSQLAGMATLTNVACDPSAAAGAVPHSMGQPAAGGSAAPALAPAAPAPKRRLLENATAAVPGGPAEPRQLLYGGGMGADATQCYVDVTSVAWWLAQAGLAINAAANKNAGASCPGPHFGPRKGKVFKYAQALCTVDVAGAIYAFGTAMQFLLLSLTHCPDLRDTKAMCGAGIDGMIASLAGMASSGSATWTTCVEFQKRGRKAALNMAAMANKLTGGRNFGNGAGALEMEGNFGRRLTSVAEAKQEIDELRQTFGTPEMAWNSIGYDLADPDAEFRKALPPSQGARDFVSLVQERHGAHFSEGVEVCA